MANAIANEHENILRNLDISIDTGLRRINNYADNIIDFSVERFIDMTIELMALIDERYNYNDTVQQYNMRLRASIRNMFNKGLFLNNNDKELFIKWSNNLINTRMDASREEIFRMAPPEALHIVGF
jgi:hypothetical protein